MTAQSAGRGRGGAGLTASARPGRRPRTARESVPTGSPSAGSTRCCIPIPARCRGGRSRRRQSSSTRAGWLPSAARRNAWTGR
jgi:hypothetical protein